MHFIPRTCHLLTEALCICMSNFVEMEICEGSESKNKTVDINNQHFFKKKMFKARMLFTIAKNYLQKP